MKTVSVAGTFDDLSARHVRSLEAASKLGSVRVMLEPDTSIQARKGCGPVLPELEREYLVSSLRYVSEVMIANPDTEPDIRVEDDGNAEASAFPRPDSVNDRPGRKKVLATGCFDWFHSGHVAFFEEVSGLGDLTVTVGSDANVRLLKGERHPMFPQNQRAFMIQAVKFVHRVLIATGTGWMDAAPEIDRIKPDIYAVNEDGDVPEKREFCAKHGLEYMVFKRIPKSGLDRRESTRLRGF